MAIDLTAVDRVDFVCAGALLNAINRVESQRESVQMGASPIIRALLLLVKFPPAFPQAGTMTVVGPK